MTSEQAKPLQLQIHAVINPATPVSVVINALATALYGLGASGLPVQLVQIDTRGLGEGYLAALQARPDLPAGVSVQPLTPASAPSLGGTTVYIPKASKADKVLPGPAPSVGGTTVYIPKASKADKVLLNRGELDVQGVNEVAQHGNAG